MSQFREQSRRLLGDDSLPATLPVIRSPRIEAMRPAGVREGLELPPHYDWLLALGSSDLGLMRLRGPMLRPSDLAFLYPLDGLWISFEDRGEQLRTRDLTVLCEDGRGFVVSAHLTRPRARWVDEFTQLLEAKTPKVDPTAVV